MFELHKFFEDALNKINWDKKPRINGFVRKNLNEDQEKSMADSIYYSFISEAFEEGKIIQTWVMSIQSLSYHDQVFLKKTTENAESYLNDIFKFFHEALNKNGLPALVDDKYIGSLLYKGATTSGDESSFFKIELEFKLIKHIAC